MMGTFGIISTLCVCPLCHCNIYPLRLSFSQLAVIFYWTHRSAACFCIRIEIEINSYIISASAYWHIFAWFCTQLSLWTYCACRFAVHLPVLKLFCGHKAIISLLNFISIKPSCKGMMYYTQMHYPPWHPSYIFWQISQVLELRWCDFILQEAEFTVSSLEETLIEVNLILDILFLAFYGNISRCNGRLWITLCSIFKVSVFSWTWS